MTLGLVLILIPVAVDQALMREARDQMKNLLHPSCVFLVGFFLSTACGGSSFMGGSAKKQSGADARSESAKKIQEDSKKADNDKGSYTKAETKQTPPNMDASVASKEPDASQAKSSLLPAQEPGLSSAEVLEKVKSSITAEKCISRLWRIQGAFNDDPMAVVGPQEIGVGMEGPCNTLEGTEKIARYYDAEPQGKDLLARSKPLFDAKCSFPAGFLLKVASDTKFTCALAGKLLPYSPEAIVGKTAPLQTVAQNKFCAVYFFEKIVSPEQCLERCKLASRMNLAGRTINTNFDEEECRFLETPLPLPAKK